MRWYHFLLLFVLGAICGQIYHPVAHFCGAYLAGGH